MSNIKDVSMVKWYYSLIFHCMGLDVRTDVGTYGRTYEESRDNQIGGLSNFLRYGAPLDNPSGRRSSAMNNINYYYTSDSL